MSDEAESAGRPATHPLPSTTSEGHTQVASTAAQGGGDGVGSKQPWLEQRHPRHNPVRTPAGFYHLRMEVQG